MTVARGPEPKAGSRPSLASADGKRHRDDRRDRTADEERDRDGRGDARVAPDRDREEEEDRADQRADDQPGQELSGGHPPNGDAGRHAADQDGLGLRADGVGHVDDRWDEERQ